MKTLSKLAIAAVGAACFSITMSKPAQAVTVTFDDLPNTSESQIQNGYGGLNWNNFYYLTGTNSPGSGYQNGTVSPGNVAYNAWGTPAAFSSMNGAFTLNSAYLTAAWTEGQQFTVEGLLNGTQLFSQLVTLSKNTPTLFNFNWSGIDTVRFSAFNSTDWVALDNLTYNEPITPVPTPALLPGLIGLGVGVLRKRKGEAVEAEADA